MREKPASLGSIHRETRLALFGPGHVRCPVRQGHWPRRSDIPCAYHIGVPLVAASDTSKAPLLRAVGASGVPALRTGLARAPRVTEDNGDAQAFGFIADLVCQIPKRPGCHHPVELLAATGAVADAIQLLQHNHRAGVLRSKVNDAPGEGVVCVLHPAPLFAALLLHPVGAPVPLVAPANLREVFSPVSCLFAAEEHYSVGGGDRRVPHHAQIHADEGRVAGTSSRRGCHADRQSDVPLPVTLEESGVSIGKSEPASVTGWNAQRQPDVLPALSGGNAQHPTFAVAETLVGVDAQADALAPAHRGERGPLSRFPQPVERAGKRHAGVDRHAGIVGGKPQFAGTRVDGLVQPCAAAGLPRLRGVQAKLHSAREGALHPFEPFPLGSVGCRDADNNAFGAVHDYIIAHGCVHVKGKDRPRRAMGAFLPRLKACGLPAPLIL